MADLIDRDRLLEYLHGEPVGIMLCEKYNLDGFIKGLKPAEQPEPCEDAVSRLDAISHFRGIADATYPKEKYNEGFVDGLEFCIAHLSTMPPVTPKQPEQGWIPVTERLPKDYDVVLMTVRRTDKTFNQIPYLRIGFCESKLWYPIPQASAPFEVSLSNYDGGDPVVTAWMPLPKPYQLDER